jgi:hypothetical protein
MSVETTWHITGTREPIHVEHYKSQAYADTPDCTELRSWVIRTPALYSDGLGFESRARERLNCRRSLESCLGIFGQMVGKYLE